MNKEIIAGVLLTIAIAPAALAGPAQAKVVNVVERIEQVNQPRQECRTGYVQEQQPRGMAGTVIGGVAGGILGNQVGGGMGNTVATAIGAVTGAVVGDQLENRDNQVVQRSVQNCYTVDQWQPRTVGYNVTYEYGGMLYNAVMRDRPGRYINVDVLVTPSSY